VSVPLAVLFYGLFWSIMGIPMAWAFFPGFIFGYLCYDMIHYGNIISP